MQVINKVKLDTVLQMSKQHQAQLINMVQTMLDGAEDNIARLQQHFQQQQFSALQQLLHKIRGGFATLGAEQLAVESKQLEHHLDTPQQIEPDELESVIQTYRATCLAIKTVLETYQDATVSNCSELDIAQLYNLLRQQDMHASDLTHRSQQALVTLLGNDIAENFIQLVTALEFAQAARLLHPHLPADHDSV